ncbi:uncharacterized protein AMSG_00392 [Thecamonas trahens ATCC 50062]|uniref:USP domain-containing protein n=1 Tax=Thecamonas trahens ATCC 50062 TaxID=461836 RepID=A0A0L0D8R8_THETB|nr:hypothetical protein AMSG_00392 [Thecamonas trahens ATCC 50062]KNC48615.1 hypothetical protein AMSG_00392 [Thecamonas trahens ATCC 50062]|eukprot:XP_013762671.1 hypothetical protein AMSG_00392 [Thecamonas trahens ATCC 50062]
MAESVVEADSELLPPTGIRNPGASDYLAVLVQALTHVPPIRNRLLFWDNPDGDKVADAVAAGTPLSDAVEACARSAMEDDHPSYRITGALQRLMARCIAGPREQAAELRDLAAAFGWSGADLAQGHDAQELYAVLIGALDSELAADTVVEVSGEAVGPSPNLISSLLTVSVKRTITCSEGHVSERADPAFSLQVRVAGQLSLVASLHDTFLTSETFDGDNQYSCSQCGVHRDAIMRHSLDPDLPPVLVFTLARIDFDFITFTRRKVNSSLEIPATLSKADLLNRPDAGADADVDADADADAPAYQLAAVVCHSGTANAGHYTAHVRDPASQTWWLADDANVEPSPLADGEWDPRR